MSKIVVHLDQKSIKSAIKRLNNLKAQFQSGIIISEFLEGVCKWLIFKASTYVKNSDIGENIKDDINNHWSYTVSGNSAKITNDSDSAVFVEFGVGSMGQKIPHDMASKSGYDYNVGNKINSSGYWVFKAESEEDVDMHKGYMAKPRSDGSLWIITKGSWRVMYAYQAIVDARADLLNRNGEIAQIWNTVKSRYV